MHFNGIKNKDLGSDLTSSCVLMKLYPKFKETL